MDEVAVGTVGEAAAIEFSGFRQNALTGQVQNLLRDPV